MPLTDLTVPLDRPPELGQTAAQIHLDVGLGDHQPWTGHELGRLPQRQPSCVSAQVHDDLAHRVGALLEVAERAGTGEHLKAARLQPQRTRRGRRARRPIEHPDTHPAGQQVTGEREPGRSGPRDQDTSGSHQRKPIVSE